jgi:hypothetical protein
MTTPNVYLPYPCPQNTTELLDDINALVAQSCVPTSLLNLVTAIEQSPEVQADIDQIEANMNSTDNE